MLELDRVSPSFCLAKWLQVSLHLHNGGAHACHHPEARRVPLPEVLADPSALHNGSAQKAVRREMREGRRPSECAYCWQAEDSGAASDRMIKSMDAWARPRLAEIARLPLEADVQPSYLEVGFSHVCNMSCSYCGPQYSSAWLSEQERFGDFPVENRSTSLAWLAREKKLPLPAEAPNPYSEAFWAWWPKLRSELRVLRVTGGEPLLHEETFRLLSELRAPPARQLELYVNSNLMAPKARFERFLEEARATAPGLAKFGIYTSIDAWGARAEYIRHGLRHAQFWENVERALARLPGIDFVFNCTFNALSVTSLRPLLERVRDLREKFPQVRFDTSYLLEPAHQSVKVLTANFVPLVAEHVRFMRAAGFSDYECAKMERVHLWLLKPDPGPRVQGLRRDFYNFFREHDRRRGTDFIKTFPELADFWKICAYAAKANAKTKEEMP